MGALGLRRAACVTPATPGVAQNEMMSVARQHEAALGFGSAGGSTWSPVRRNVPETPLIHKGDAANRLS